jgi:hypothetical protein
MERAAKAEVPILQSHHNVIEPGPSSLWEEEFNWYPYMYIAETDAVAVVIVFEPNSCRGVLDTTLCDKVCKGLATGWRGYFWREGSVTFRF